MLNRKQSLCALLLGITLLAPTTSKIQAQQQPWETTVSPYQPATFPEPRPVRVQYSFSWNNFAAATANLRFSKAGGRLQFEGSGGTIGVAAKLWKYQANHTATSEAGTLRPVEVREHEIDRNREITTALTFTPEGVTSQQQERKGSAIKEKTRQFDFPNVLSINSALLLLRTHAFPEGAVERIVVYPSTSAYLCTIKSLGRDRVTVAAGTYPAIKLDLQLTKIGKNRELSPHKKFKSATIWLSDDSDRLPLRIEAQISVGTVSAELQSAQFEDAKP